MFHILEGCRTNIQVNPLQITITKQQKGRRQVRYNTNGNVISATVKLNVQMYETTHSEFFL